MVEKSLVSERGRTYYWIDKNKNSDAKCIVFTHGLTANHNMFEKQVEFFKKDYTVITWDVPLHGKSRPYSDFSYHNTALELNSTLEAEDIEKVVLVGMSMGGYPSQMFASMYPNKVAGFVALDTTPFGLEYYSKSDNWWLKQVKPMTKMFPDKMLRNSIAKSNSRTKYGYELLIDMLKDSTKADIIEQMGIAYSGFLKENCNMNFDIPVIILLGEHDKTGKVKEYCKKWAEREGYPLHIIKNAAHFSNADNYEDVNKGILSFISDL